MATPAKAAVANLSAKALAHASNTGRQLTGSKTAVVVTAGTMDKTVKVRLWGQRWEKKIQKVRRRLFSAFLCRIRFPSISIA
jgi:hypothetical protein